MGRATVPASECGALYRCRCQVMDPKAQSPAAQLLGRKLEGGWQVESRVDRPTGTTGGAFSQSYLLRNDDGRDAFLKALDYSAALGAPDPAAAINELTTGFLHERDLLQRCAGDRLSHIVLSIGSGVIEIPGHGPLSRVQYLILERALHDVRTHLLLEQFDVAWVLRSLHHVAVGLRQLHSHDIFHQDTKPSNVLVFADGMRKIGDLGRATLRGRSAKHDSLEVAGDELYAPPELLYRYLLPDDVHRRMACDMYHVGSMLHFFFTGVGTTAALHTKLDRSHYPAYWHGRYTEILPYVRDAYDRVCEEFAGSVPTDLAPRLLTLLRELSDPDPALRGDNLRRSRRQNPFELERYVSRMNLLAREAELGLTKIVLR
jgi:eukaryotic-like serine/threonine-protein kinase